MCSDRTGSSKDIHTNSHPPLKAAQNENRNILNQTHRIQQHISVERMRRLHFHGFSLNGRVEESCGKERTHQLVRDDPESNKQCNVFSLPSAPSHRQRLSFDHRLSPCSFSLSMKPPITSVRSSLDLIRCHLNPLHTATDRRYENENHGVSASLAVLQIFSLHDRGFSSVMPDSGHTATYTIHLPLALSQLWGKENIFLQIRLSMTKGHRHHLYS